MLKFFVKMSGRNGTILLLFRFNLNKLFSYNRIVEQTEFDVLKRKRKYEQDKNDKVFVKISKSPTKADENKSKIKENGTVKKNKDVKTSNLRQRVSSFEAFKIEKKLANGASIK